MEGNKGLKLVLDGDREYGLVLEGGGALDQGNRGSFCGGFEWGYDLYG